MPKRELVVSLECQQVTTAYQFAVSKVRHAILNGENETKCLYGNKVQN